VAADCVVFGWDGRRLHLLLIERGGEPFRGCWAFPGGFVEIDEDLDAGARRELCEETALAPRVLKQFQSFGEPQRDPRERVISVAYFGLVDRDRQAVRASSDAKHVEWFPLNRLPALAFDHTHILGAALARLRTEALLFPLGLDVLPDSFSAAELGGFYAAVLQRKVRPDALVQRLVRLGLVQRKSGRGPATTRFSFNRRTYSRLERAGLAAKVSLPLATGFC
jgi:8-oxo-dGTP diphosphatase